MKKIASSIITIVATLAAVSGATYAVLSDTEVIEANTISTSTVNIVLGGLNSGQISKPLNVGSLVPGQWSKWARAIVYNRSDTPVKTFFHVDGLEGEACQQTNIRIATRHPLPIPAPLPFPYQVIDDRIADVVSDDVAALERSHVLYNGPLSGITGPENRIDITRRIVNPDVLPKVASIIQQQAQFDITAGNEIQGKTCTWDEFVVAESIAP